MFELALHDSDAWMYTGISFTTIGTGLISPVVAYRAAGAALLCGRIKSTLGIARVRGDTFGYLQRSFDGCVSNVDRREARVVGEFAVKQAIWGASDGSVVIRRIGDYVVDYALVKLADVAGKTKVMPDAFIASSNSDITPAFHAYLRPLLGGGG
jgi:6-phosphofructokinase